MTETQATAPANRISAFLLMIVFITLALSFAALIFAVYILEQNTEAEAAWILTLLGFIGVGNINLRTVPNKEKNLKAEDRCPPSDNDDRVQEMRLQERQRIPARRLHIQRRRKLPKM